MTSTRIASLLCSRLCHDLVGPIGALNNGVELLGDDDDPELRRQALDLLGDSAAEALRRLTFFRLAFGMAGGFSDAIGLSELRKAAAGLFTQGRTRLDWPEVSPGAPPGLPKLQARLLLNLVLVAASCLPKGGVLSVAVTGEAAATVTASGPGARLEAETAEALTGKLGDEQLDPRSVVSHLLATLAAEGGVRLETKTGEGLLYFTLRWH